MKRIKLLATLLCATMLLGCAPKNITIEWDNSTCHFVTPGVYARITKVDNRHALVYNAGAPALIRFSDDKCESWSEPSEVARAEGYSFTNCGSYSLLQRRPTKFCDNKISSFSVSNIANLSCPRIDKTISPCCKR